MITAVDSSVLFDVLAQDAGHAVTSEAALTEAMAAGDLVACEVVWAETAAWFASNEQQLASLWQIGVRFLPLEAEASHLAGQIWRRYRETGGRRSRLVSDFLIGAHARSQADQLLTRDRGFYRNHFADLRVVEPSQV